jgi:signal transduction histidine kinase
MQYANELFFFIFALILWGLVIASLPLIKSKEEDQSDKYWFWALILAAAAYSFFAIASTTYIALITLANTCFVASHLYLAFFTRSLHKPVTRKLKYLSLLGLLVFGIVFEILRQKFTFADRVNFVGITSILCLIWTCFSLIVIGVRKFTQLKFLLIFSILEIILCLSRLVFLYIESPPANIYIYQESFLSTIFRLSWFAFQALSYTTIFGYFIEKISVDRALSKAEKDRIATLNQELLKVSNLLVEKDELLKALSQEKLKSERANEAKGQFLANVSHEIRTPLHGLIGLTSMTLKSSMSEDIRKSLDKVLYSSKALLVILNDILDFSKIEAGVIDIINEPFKVGHLIDDVGDLFSIPAVEKGIQLRFDIDPKIPEVMIGDFYKLRQVLFNLVGNSIKFTEQGFVEIKVRADHIEAESVRLTMTVKDTGIGISAQDLKVIFEPFNQLDNTNSRRYDGVGLGLPITKSLLLKMGSELMIKSQPGVGTEFSFEILLKINDQIPYKHRTLQTSIQDQESSLPYASLAGRRVLVVEDNQINIEVVGQYLKFLKIESHFVTDGLQCLEALKNNRYECILMDIQMPNLDGIQATYQIRLMDGLKDMPIIGLSAGVAESDREKGLQSGMNDFLAKPFEIEDLAKTLMKYLG